MKIQRTIDEIENIIKEWKNEYARTSGKKGIVEKYSFNWYRIKTSFDRAGQPSSLSEIEKAIQILKTRPDFKPCLVCNNSIPNSRRTVGNNFCSDKCEKDKKDKKDKRSVSLVSL